MAAALAAAGSPAQTAGTPDNARDCSVRSQSAAIVIMVCRSGFDADRIRQAAQTACGSRESCNVWVWDDEAKAPKQAPAKDADLSKVHTGSAIAVWAHDSKGLVRLRPVKGAGPTRP